MNSREEQNLRKKNASLEDELRDLKAQLQHKNRALEIEAALEKIREKTITIRESSELSQASAVMLEQLRDLGITVIRTAVGIFDDENEAMELWHPTTSDSQEGMKVLDYFSLHIHPVFENIIPARQQKKPYALTVLKGSEVKQYYQMMSTFLSQQQQQVYHQEEFFYSFFFFQGTLNVITRQPLEEEECNIMIQFASAFGLIYTRFLDLKRAEAQTYEALRKASLDRVRAEIASMRTADDLQRIIPLIWHELTTLGVPFFRCGVFIVDDQAGEAHVYLSTPSGESLAVMHLKFGSTSLLDSVVKFWRKEQVYMEKWDRNQFLDWTRSILEQGIIESPEKYQGGEEAPEALVLQFAPFRQGMLYVGSHEQLEYTQIELVCSLADSFSFAYARYEDFKQLEEAKRRVEATLAELRSTQTQLVQSEKMASLGELTAGIAHEIQNPLNFVNNFAAVNIELIEEINEEIRQGNYEEVKTIAKDLLGNEQKIVHHGRRADAIVKNMLQHSRAGSGEMETTDINVLADEYLRLAYHGMRAKEKAFNVTMNTDFDQNLERINIVPQDMGRVLLNLITNAFYAVRDKRQKNGENYQPTVWVSSQKYDSKIEIRVKDNGCGIPQKVQAKIFQPFFSTRPTGQGTGLGLSLSYDIVKAHGGEIKVESKEGEGSEFIITLPSQ